MNRLHWISWCGLGVLILAGGSRTCAASASLGGMSGLLNVPVATVTPEGVYRLGYNLVDRNQSYEGRGTLDNRIYFFTMGFLPRTEVSIRATVLPGESFIDGLKADGIDRMGSGRVQVLEEKSTPGDSTGRPMTFSWPSLAVGMDDIKGTRRYHSFYMVATKTLTDHDGFFRGSLTAGYGFRTFRAGRHLLDGKFAGAEFYVGKWAGFVVEYDSEKWNGGMKVLPAFPLTAQLALLNFDTLSGGVAWTHHF